MAVKNLLIRGGANFSGIQKEVAKTQRTLSGFQNNVAGIMKKISFALGGLAIGKLVKDSTSMAMSVESAMDNINRTMQSSAASFKKWVDTQSSGLGIAKAEAYKYGSTYSNLLSSFIKGSDETAKQTEELMKATAIIASKTGRTYEDTAERIRSGMLGSTEAIEDLGVYTNISMIESTNAFKKFAGDKSWSQLSFQTQQQIRLSAILEQTYARYGDTLADTTQTRQAQFIASLKNVQLSLGQAFLPIYNAILPPLITFANALGKVINLIAQFTQALFGAPKSSKAQTNAVNSQASAIGGLGDSASDAGKKAKKAGKDAKSALAGFDELNTLKSSSGSGDDEESDGVSAPSLDTSGFIDSTVEVSEKVQAMADKVKKAFGVMKNAFDSLKNSFIANKDVILSVIGGIIGGFAAFEIITKWTKIVGAFSKALGAIGGIISGISIPILAISAIIGLLIGNIIYLWRTNEDFRNSVIEVWNNIKEFLSTIITDIGTILTDLWNKYGQTFIDDLKGFMESIQKIIINVWENIIKPIINGALEMLTWLWDKHLKGLIEELGAFIMKLVNGALEIWNKFISPIVNFLIKVFGPAFSETFNFLVDLIGTSVAVISDIFKALLRVFGGIIDFIVGVFTLNWRKAWQGIQDIFGGIMDGLVGLIRWPLNAIIDLINYAIDGLNGLLSFKMPNFLGGGQIGIKVPKIPKLAQGGYVGANNPMLAMIGDNTQEGEIVAPESKIYEQTFNAISDALRMNNGTNNSNNDRPMEVTVKIGDTTLGKAVAESINRITRQTGECPIII